MRKASRNRLASAIRNHNMSDARNLCNVYNDWSAAKERAYDYCLNQFDNLNGHDFRICSANTYTFTVGFYFTNEDGKECFAYITRDNDWYCEL